MKRILIPVILLVMLTSLACSFTVNLPQIRTTPGPTETLTVAVPVGNSAQTSRVTIGMGAGTLKLEPGAANLVDGTVRYNVTGLKPVVTQSGSDVSIKQETTRHFDLPDNNLVNDWTLALNSSQPIDLTVQAGAYKGTMNLTGLKLENLSITDGAAQTEVHFNTANPTVMHELTYRTGASEVKLFGLANANFDHMIFESGAGAYTLDFSGKLERDATVDVRSGVSSVTIIVPAGMVTRVLNEGGISGVDTQGNWSTSGTTYRTSGSGPILTIKVSMGVGSLKLEQQ